MFYWMYEKSPGIREFCVVMAKKLSLTQKIVGSIPAGDTCHEYIKQRLVSWGLVVQSLAYHIYLFYNFNVQIILWQVKPRV